MCQIRTFCRLRAASVGEACALLGCRLRRTFDALNHHFAHPCAVGSARVCHAEWPHHRAAFHHLGRHDAPARRTEAALAPAARTVIIAITPFVILPAPASARTILVRITAVRISAPCRSTAIGSGLRGGCGRAGRRWVVSLRRLLRLRRADTIRYGKTGALDAGIAAGDLPGPSR